MLHGHRFQNACALVWTLVMSPRVTLTDKARRGAAVALFDHDPVDGEPGLPTELFERGALLEDAPGNGQDVIGNRHPICSVGDRGGIEVGAQAAEADHLMTDHADEAVDHRVVQNRVRRE